MKSFQVITDSTSDVESFYRKEYGLDYVKMVFNINGKDYPADLDWEELSAVDYYNLMRKGHRATTGLVSALEFNSKFEKYLSLGMDVLYISCSSKLSGSLNNGKIVAAELQDKYPNNKVICFDSLRSNYAQGMMALDACKLANEGKSIDYAVKELSINRLRYQTYATVDSLEWLRKAGRVKASSAFFGNLFGVKPIIVGDAIGNNYAFKKIRGRRQSLEALAKIVEDRISNKNIVTVFIEHADCLEDAIYLKDLILSKVNSLKINISSVGPIIGATVGPNSITVNFFGDKVSIIGE